MSRPETTPGLDKPGDYVGDQIVFDQQHAVFQLQLALFESGNLQLVDKTAIVASVRQRIDGHIKVAMLATQHFQSFTELLLVHCRLP